MLEFTSGQIIIFLILSVLLSVFYLIIYSKKGANKTVYGYVTALGHCFVYAILAFFGIVGIGLVKEAITSSQLAILVVPIGWLLLIFIILRKSLKTDFNLGGNTFSINPDIKNELVFITVLLFISIGFIIAVVMTAVSVLSNNNNLSGAIILILIIGTVFGIPAVFMLGKAISKIRELYGKLR